MASVGTAEFWTGEMDRSTIVIRDQQTGHPKDTLTTAAPVLCMISSDQRCVIASFIHSVTAAAAAVCRRGCAMAD